MFRLTGSWFNCLFNSLFRLTLESELPMTDHLWWYQGGVPSQRASNARIVFMSLLSSQKTRDAMITLLLRQNDVPTSLWHNNYVIFTSFVRCGSPAEIPISVITQWTCQNVPVLKQNGNDADSIVSIPIQYRHILACLQGNYIMSTCRAIEMSCQQYQ